MDHRIPLAVHSILEFDGMQCHVESVVGCGTNAIVYKGWYPDRLKPELRHHVLIKELFPMDPQGRIWRTEDNRIRVEPEAENFWHTHRESFLAGNEIHLRLLEDHPDRLGANLNSFALGDTLYSVLGFTGGRSLLTELAEPDQPLRKHVQRMLGLLDALEAFHKSGYQHLDISPVNIMLTGSGDTEQMFLIDYNSARQLGDRGGAYSSFKAGYSAPEVETDGSDEGFASDLYSVAAVFYRCLMGRPLTLRERLREKPPEGRESPCLKDQPQTVISMVGSILRRGLHPLPQRRYQSIGQMRRAFRELLDRIDGVGVTHWALWESGKHSVENLVCVNPSLHYVTETEKLYPIRLKKEKICNLPDYLAEILSPGGKSGLIQAGGGMGKTTLLLYAAMLQGRYFRPVAPAVCYISVSGWTGSETHYIRNQLLMSLRFKPEENTYDSAMHAMLQLLNRPLRTQNGPVPVVLLLLDGLNEVRSEMQPLLREIRELSELEGVRILAASRSEIPELPLETAELIPLLPEDIGSILGARGMLVPRDPEVLSLLRTPLILAAFVQAGMAGRQPDVHSEQELMQAYLDALLQKEQDRLPENAPERWLAEAAIKYLLPCIAEEEKRKGSGLSQQQLLRVVQRCWKTLGSGTLRRIFPQWIGHTRDILGESQNAEEWYGLMIHRLLWQRMGLLLRDGSGNYRIFHQRVEEYLAERNAPFRKKARRKQAAGIGILGVLLLCLGLYGLNIRLERDENYEKAIDYGAVSYVAWGWQYEQLRQLAEDALSGDREAFFTDYDSALQKLSSGSELTAARELYRIHITENVLPLGDRKVSWSRRLFQGELALELVNYATDRADYYRTILPVVASWMASEEAQADCPELVELFYGILEADADVAGELYHQVCAVHLEGGDPIWQQGTRELVAVIPEQEAHRTLQTMEDRRQHLENLRGRLSLAQRSFTQAKAAVEFSFQYDARMLEQAFLQAKKLIEEACGTDVVIVLEKKEALMELSRYLPVSMTEKGRMEK